MRIMGSRLAWATITTYIDLVSKPHTHTMKIYS
jgi:hypothetical protein